MEISKKGNNRFPETSDYLKKKSEGNCSLLRSSRLNYSFYRQQPVGLGYE